MSRWPEQEEGAGLPLIVPDLSIREALLLLVEHAAPAGMLVDARGRRVGMIGDSELRALLLSGHGARSMALDWKAPSRTAAQDDPTPIAVVMVGGRGVRLRPLTDSTPKPLLSVGGVAILDRLLASLAEAGVEKVYLAGHYLPERFIGYLAQREWPGMLVRYLHETEPLGTAGALAGIAADGGRPPMLVVNGDIVTDLRFGRLLAYHRFVGADITLVAAEHEQRLPYGLLEVDGVELAAMEEKPCRRVLVNAGIYVIEEPVCALVPADRHVDMDEVVRAARCAGMRICVFPLVEHWDDVGDMAAYRRLDVVGPASEASL